MEILVSSNTLSFRGKNYRCAIGQNGFSASKKEGDGCTPIGVFPLRELWYRADRLEKPNTKLPARIIAEHDGWCDDPASPDYNKPVTLPYNFSHEKLWREDNLYDLIIPIGYNDENIVAVAGSAIFMHIAKPNYEGTEGCIALSLPDFMEILPHIDAKTMISISN